MTQSYFGTLKRHGVKLSVALFLGYLFHVAMAYLAAFLLIIFAVFIGSVASLLDAEPSEHGKIVLGAVFFFSCSSPALCRKASSPPEPTGLRLPAFSAGSRPSAPFFLRDSGTCGKCSVSRSFWSFF